MVKIEFVGGISKELAAVIEEHNIPCTCIEDNICEMTENAYDELYKRARAAFDGNDTIVVEHFESELSLSITTLEDLEKYFNEDYKVNNDEYAEEARLAIKRNGWKSGCGKMLNKCDKVCIIICSEGHSHLACNSKDNKCFIYQD